MLNVVQAKKYGRRCFVTPASQFGFWFCGVPVSLLVTHTHHLPTNTTGYLDFYMSTTGGTSDTWVGVGFGSTTGDMGPGVSGRQLSLASSEFYLLFAGKL